MTPQLLTAARLSAKVSQVDSFHASITVWKYDVFTDLQLCKCLNSPPVVINYGRGLFC